MGILEEQFRGHLEKLLTQTEWQPLFVSGRERRRYFGEDRLREWIQPDRWVTLEAVGFPTKLTVLAEIDTSPGDLEHNVAKYLWWASTHKPFWKPPALLINAYRESAPKNYLLHETIARFTGQQLRSIAPGTQHALVTLRGESLFADPGFRLADLAFREISNWWIQDVDIATLVSDR